jgi:hypothetical protein
MTKPDLDTAVSDARQCVIKINEFIALTELKTDEEKLVFWSIFFGYAVAACANQVGVITTDIILNSLITAIQEDEFKSYFH